jgi:hypothetical protein
MTLEELRERFIVADDVIKVRLEPIVAKALKHCLIDKTGQVHVSDKRLSGKQQVMLTIAARAIASQLDPTISANVTVGEIAKYTGLPENQVRARGKDFISAKLAESPQRGVFRAVFHKVEAFLDSIASD